MTSEAKQGDLLDKKVTQQSNEESVDKMNKQLLE